MISSEVQRTLVKSPPELWTELSDPDALARHLGALGEIRITRTKPEELIEWEAERTTGTVAIKASGWGTKVTLTVSREPDVAADVEPDAGSARAAEEENEEAAHADLDDLAAATGEATGDAEPIGEEPASGNEPIGEAAEVALPAMEVKPAPATEAARRAAGWPASAPPGPAIESDLRAAEAAEPEEPDAMPVVLAQEPQLEPVPEPESEPEPAMSAPDPEPRPGFFARLFGRRRRRTESASASPIAEPYEIESPERETEEIATEQPPLETTPEPEPLPITVLEAPDEADGEPDPPRALAEPEPADLHEPSAVTEPDDDTPAPLAGETEVPESKTEEPESKTEAPESADLTGEPADIAAELKAAEEVTIKDVTAVLTGVLDRLGAAHRRPFSRA